MRILISYSKFHYDPPAKIDLTYSTSFIGRAIYEACQSLGEVTYIDPAESDSVRGQAFDLFVSQINQFSKISSNIHAKHSVLFMVTTHPANRNKVLRAEAKRLGVPVTETLKAAKGTFDRADLILQIGGDWALQALLNAGVSRSKILNIHYGAQHIPFNDKRNFSKPYRFLFLATELGLRKGIVHALDAFVGLDGDYQLTLVGKIPGPEYESRIREATDKNDLIRYVGWIESNTEAYQNLLADHHFIVFPSLEEGEAGTVLEGLSSGLVPITTGERVGIDYSPLGNFVPHADNSELVKRAIALSPEGLGTLSKQARHYVDTIHYWPLFKARLQEIFDKILLGRLAEITRPKVSLILPVFNKEESIVRLLRHLHQTTRSYQNYDLHLFFDGCIDRSRERAKKYLAKCDMDVTYYETPNLFETRTNNIGLRAADGKYCVILQDDIVLYEKHWLEKFVYFMETNPRVGVLGGLAGVNYYPSDTSLEGPGVSSYKFERSRRIDVLFEPKLWGKVQEVDAVMRGPIMLRKALLEEFGYLDEDKFAPLYQDDMDLCFRLRKNGYSVFYYPIDVVNEMSTIARYDQYKSLRWQSVVDQHLRLFYDRWQPNSDKSSYLTLSKPQFNNLYRPTRTSPKPLPKANKNKPIRSSLALIVFRLLRQTPNIFDSHYCAGLADRMWKRRVLWTQEQIAFLPAGTKLLDLGAGTCFYRQNAAHCDYITLDFAQTPNLPYGKIDIIGDICAIPVASESLDAVLCTEVLEHVPDPIGALREIARILRPGGKLILTAPLGSGLHQLPYLFYEGYTRQFYERHLPELGLNNILIEPNGGLFGHLVEMNGRAFSYIEAAFRSGPLRLFRPLSQLALQNIPAVVYSMLEDLKVVEDFTVNYHVVAEKQKRTETAESPLRITTNPSNPCPSTSGATRHEPLLKSAHLPAQLLIKCRNLLVHPVMKLTKLYSIKGKRLSYSQCGEDLIVSFIFDALGISKPSYLDIGAHHPTYLNNTYLFYQKGCEGVCIEPNPALFAQIQRIRKRDICLNVGVGIGLEREADFFVMSSDTLSTFSRETAERYQSYGNQKIEKVIHVPLVPVNNIIKEHFKDCPNFISLDVEGIELAVLEIFDFDSFRPAVFCIETLTYTKDKSEKKIEEIAHLMHSKGYFTYADTYINTIFLDKQAWLSRK